MRRAIRPLVAAIVSACLAALPILLDARTAAGLPTRLTDREFWKLSTDLSEPDGTFRSDNLVSNEQWLQHVIPDLIKDGAGRDACIWAWAPNRTSLTSRRSRPAMAFVIDIRRGNLALHLMYKALFEVSADRAEFVSRLFSRKPVRRAHREVDRRRTLRRAP